MKSNKPIKVKLVGGLGNQLFIWAMAYALERQTGKKVCLDASECTQWGEQLNLFGITVQIPGPKKPDGKLRTRLPNNDNFVINIARGVREKTRELSLGNTYWEKPSKSYDKEIFGLRDGTILRGYFQSYKYFESYSSEIRNTLRLGHGISEQIIGYTAQLPSNWTAINLRLGADYTRLDSTFGLVTEKYLNESLALINSSNIDSTNVVFTDDVYRAKRIYPNAAFYISQEEISSPSERMLLMSMATNFIGSNSTYSWWAAFLMNQEVGTRIFPTPWFKNLKVNTEHLLPTHWTQVSTL